MSDASLGFQLRELRLRGAGLDSGSLLFVNGLNVVEGPSDTGKSFAVACIDFVLGASDRPEEIPEAEGYEIAYLQIEGSNGLQYSLRRLLSGGRIGLFKGTIDDALESTHASWQELGATAKAKNSLSEFLMSLCSLTEKRVRKNNRGVTEKASFRVLAKALIVDEQRVIAKRSPIRGTQATRDTAADSTIRLLLTGHDDSAIAQIQDQKTAIGWLAGRREAIGATIAREQAQIAELLGDHGSIDESVAALERLDGILASLSEDVAAAAAELQTAEDQRRTVWAELRERRERLTELDGLLGRAALLDEHYASDLSRLDAVVESAHLLRHYAEKPCQMCGADPQHHQHEHGQPPELVIEAAEVEAQKIGRLRRELGKATNQILEERGDINQSVKTLSATIDQLSARIDQDLAPRVRNASTVLQGLQRQYECHLRVRETAERLAFSQQELARVPTKPESPPKKSFAKLSPDTMMGVCQQVAWLLIQWQMFKLPTVDFDPKTADLFINDRPRTSHGKGVRAVLCAAYVIGLMQHCLREERGHPGFVVVDTPLNPYRQRRVDDGGGLKASVKEAFYRDLCNGSGQVIIFENVEPPADVQKACHYVSFSKPDRRGFLPERRSTSSR